MFPTFQHLYLSAWGMHDRGRGRRRSSGNLLVDPETYNYHFHQTEGGRENTGTEKTALKHYLVSTGGFVKRLVRTNSDLVTVKFSFWSKMTPL